MFLALIATSASHKKEQNNIFIGVYVVNCFLSKNKFKHVHKEGYALEPPLR